MAVLKILPLVATFHVLAGCSLIPNIEKEVNSCQELRKSHFVQEQIKRAKSQGQEKLIVNAPSSSIGKTVNCVYEL